MPDYDTLSCPSCGGKLEIPSDVDRFACARCGIEHIVERSGGMVSLAPVVDEPYQVGTSPDKKALEIATQTLNTQLAALEEEKHQLASTMLRGFGWRTVLGQFLLGVAVAVAAFSYMPGETNPGEAFAFGAVVFFLLFFVHLYRYRRTRIEEARQIQEAMAEIDEKIGLKKEEIARFGTTVPVRHSVGRLSLELATISRLENEIAELQEQRRMTRSKRMNRHWLISIFSGLTACAISLVLLLAESGRN